MQALLAQTAGSYTQHLSVSHSTAKFLQLTSAKAFLACVPSVKHSCLHFMSASPVQHKPGVPALQPREEPSQSYLHPAQQWHHTDQMVSIQCCHGMACLSASTVQKHGAACKRQISPVIIRAAQDNSTKNVRFYLQYAPVAQSMSSAAAQLRTRLLGGCLKPHTEFSKYSKTALVHEALFLLTCHIFRRVTVHEVHSACISIITQK